MKNTTYGLIGSGFMLSLFILPGWNIEIKVVSILVMTYLLGWFSHPFFMERGI